MNELPEAGKFSLVAQEVHTMGIFLEIKYGTLESIISLLLQDICSIRKGIVVSTLIFV